MSSFGTRRSDWPEGSGYHRYGVIHDRGDGPPLMVIPGIQGRWQWLRPALTALARSHRTISYSLCGDFGSGCRLDRSLGFDNYLRQLDGVFERTGVQRAAVCGVSYGGFIALRYAATRPERVSHLILTSSPDPTWIPNDRQARYISTPWVSTPSFVATAPARLWPEIAAAFSAAHGSFGFCARYLARVAAAPALPSLMGERIREQQTLDFRADCAAVRCPTLITSGEPHLDRVVPVESTRRYLSLIPGAKYAMIERTGHLGLITRPDAYAATIHSFLSDADCS